MQIECSPWQFAQNRYGIAKRRDPASNSTLGRDGLRLKHANSSVATDEGTQNLFSEPQVEKAFLPMVSTDDTGRNMTSSSSRQHWKQKSEIHRTEAGTENDRRRMHMAKASRAKTEIREFGSNSTRSMGRPENAEGPIIST
jgi:hypothetical protein